MNSLTEENYLKTLFNIAQEKGEVTVHELSQKLNIKMPTVNSMVKKLADKKLVHYEKYKPLKLTEKGKTEAGLIIRKHRLTEMFLVDKMGFGWEQVHEIAEQIEHIQSAAYFDKMDEMLGYPVADPHGSPIPDRQGRIKTRKLLKLSNCKPGDSVKLSAVLDSSSEFLKYLNSRELRLGSKIIVKSVESFDGNMTVSYSKRPLEVFSRSVCERLTVIEES